MALDIRQELGFGRDVVDEAWPGPAPGELLELAQHAEIPLECTGALDALVAVPDAPIGVALLVHGCSAAPGCPGAAKLGRTLLRRGFAVVMPELLTPDEAQENARTGRFAREGALLVERAVTAGRWIGSAPATRGLALGCVGTGTGAAIVLAAAAALSERVRAAVSCAGRLDLVRASTLARVDAPVLLVAGIADGGPRAPEKDARVLAVNRSALERLPCARLVVLRGAAAWDGDTGACETVAALAAEWLERHLRVAVAPASAATPA